MLPCARVVRESALPLLCCPSCAGQLALSGAEREADGHIMRGILTCGGCSARFPVRGGVPCLIPGTVAEAATETAARFGAQWKTFAHMSSYQEQWLKDWLAPIRPEDFQGKVVLEGGCGKGRHTIVASTWGPRAIVSLDLGEAVEVAFAHTRDRENVHVVQGDILHPPVGRVFDLAFSVGVLHHLPEPRAGFDALRGRVKPGGRIAIWVYGRESNEWIVRWVNPLREKVTARLPPRLLYWLSLPPSAALATGLRLYRRNALANHLPYRDYMKKLATVPLREVHNIVYDQLVTPIAYYLPEEEVRSWFEVDGLEEVILGWHNRNSWRACARVT
jgi:SAM-dependent methyltransferase